MVREKIPKNSAAIWTACSDLKTAMEKSLSYPTVELFNFVCCVTNTNKVLRIENVYYEHTNVETK